MMGRSSLSIAGQGPEQVVDESCVHGDPVPGQHAVLSYWLQAHDGVLTRELGPILWWWSLLSTIKLR